ncbi:hypothetical protein EH230_02165 [Flavobacterium columnare]|uniref:Sugar 3,4-ketoisomerase QdtA cupin domain-containing protein n=1 Tax=Flavobacterium columnare TaxID=996 RepID=A0A437UDT1_9FLAO|nr:hypothetical protein [Flavobacterium columnare]RVU91804.1 hypothetical protein EH230_02165 [Flavobacterium columnare]
MFEPILIEGGFYEDVRGVVSFVNGFSFDNIERFYIVENSLQNPLRAWQGHKLDEKNFYCVTGEFKIGVVKIDDWENPSVDLDVKCYTLKASDSKILKIPGGYANAVLSLQEGSKLISFSTLPLNRTKEDDFRFSFDYWKLDE